MVGQPRRFCFIAPITFVGGMGEWWWGATYCKWISGECSLSSCWWTWDVGCVCSFLIYWYKVKIDFVLTKIAVTYLVLWEPRYGHVIVEMLHTEITQKVFEILSQIENSVGVFAQVRCLVIFWMVHGNAPSTHEYQKMLLSQQVQIYICSNIF